MSTPYTFTLRDFVAQMTQVRRLGAPTRALARLAGFAEIAARLRITPAEIERQMSRISGIFDAMTPYERDHPDALTPQRRRRVARGAGVLVTDVSTLLRQYEQSARMMAEVRRFRWGGWFRTRPVLATATHRHDARDPSLPFTVWDYFPGLAAVLWVLAAIVGGALWVASYLR